MSDFKREERYIVIKLTDLKDAPLSNMERNVLDDVCRHVNEYRQEAGKAPFECVVVESDWPEYEPTWAAIEARMSQQPTQEEKKL